MQPQPRGLAGVEAGCSFQPRQEESQLNLSVAPLQCSPCFPTHYGISAWSHRGLRTSRTNGHCRAVRPSDASLTKYSTDSSLLLSLGSSSFMAYLAIPTIPGQPSRRKDDPNHLKAIPPAPHPPQSPVMHRRLLQDWKEQGRSTTPLKAPRSGLGTYFLLSSATCESLHGAMMRTLMALAQHPRAPSINMLEACSPTSQTSANLLTTTKDRSRSSYTAWVESSSRLP